MDNIYVKSMTYWYVRVPIRMIKNLTADCRMLEEIGMMESNNILNPSCLEK